MELKKSPQADLQNKRLLFFETGLCTAFLIVVLAFSWNQKEVTNPELPVIPEPAPITEEIVEITRQEPRPAVPQKQQQIRIVSEILQIVKDDSEIVTEIEFDDFSEEIIVADISAGGGSSTEEEVDFGDDIYVKVEDDPKFMGRSWESFNYWVARNIKYPKAAIKNNIQGQVKIRFVIEKDGSISNIEVVSSPNPILSEEALRVIKESPAEWTPGKQRNVPVRVRFEIPVDFYL